MSLCMASIIFINCDVSHLKPREPILFSMKKSIFVLLLGFISCLRVSSQSVAPFVVSTAGDYFSNSNGSIQWTMGETMIETYGNASNFITQGFEQPEDFTTSISTDISTDISIFPNPATDRIYLEFGNNSDGDYSIEIDDVLGQKNASLLINIQSGNKEEISLTGLAAGVYFISVRKIGSAESFTFKVNKIY